MNVFSLSGPGVRAGGRLWNCTVCRNQTAAGVARIGQRYNTRPFTSRTYQSNGGKKGQREGPRKALLWASTGTGTIGATFLAFSDDIKTGIDATERTTRVATALAVCINDYRTTLNTRETTSDEKEKDELLKACHQRCADRTLKVLEKNGGIYIKLGQHLSAMNYLLPSEWTTTFLPLQDKCPVSSFESIQDMFKKDTGEDLWFYFSEFADQPIGAASLAQVHIATMKDTGRKVAVKVQHPELEAWAPLDLATTRFTFSTLKRFFPEYDLEWLSSEMDVSLPKELNFVEEADNARRMKEHFAKLPELPLIIPEVLWAKKRILVMACEPGKRPDDLEYLDANGIDRDEVSSTFGRIFNEMIFGDGAPLHCDPHGGNIAIRKNDSRRRFGRGPNFDIILYDHGLYRDIPLPLRRSYAKMWLAVIDGDVPRMKKYAYEVAGIEEKDFPLFASAITGRDYSIVSKQGSILQTRTSDEQQNMSGALQEGLIVDLVQLLSRVPRIILLILKTNDLTRSLDENLQTRQGPIRNFMILARYCARTVFYEKLEEIRATGSLIWPANALRMFAAWLSFARVELKLEAFELYLGVKRMLGMQSTEFGSSPLQT
ncbi:ABC1 family-domain-containing protein [Emericellopsis atlantica]|uniref:ABC1 family-domain-containing protein n=1 Tax=Emericellopsis atlantica TaxID=2614577 RepID=A0A9P7ZHH2_9HYPO|nr:ABC1 family-domain-containing protein [Emericellopsis atlantica]KAG9252100.1 ABC1 family-domain-containing protein [Emericellopsis atlantica]